MTCRCCTAPAEASIPDGRVCRQHAIEYYTGLVAFGAACSRAGSWTTPIAALVHAVPRVRDCARCGKVFSVTLRCAKICAPCQRAAQRKGATRRWMVQRIRARQPQTAA